MCDTQTRPQRVGACKTVRERETECLWYSEWVRHIQKKSDSEWVCERKERGEKACMCDWETASACGKGWQWVYVCVQTLSNTWCTFCELNYRRTLKLFSSMVTPTVRSHVQADTRQDPLLRVLVYIKQPGPSPHYLSEPSHLHLPPHSRNMGFNLELKVQIYTTPGSRCL